MNKDSSLPAKLSTLKSCLSTHQRPYGLECPHVRCVFGLLDRTLALISLPMSLPPTADFAWLNAPLACQGVARQSPHY